MSEFSTNYEWTQVDWDNDDDWIYRLDVDLYPCDSPCTPGLMKSLFSTAPSLAFKLLSHNPPSGPQDPDALRAGVPPEVLAVAVFVPLNARGWSGLSSGLLVEGELDGETLFDPARDKELGLHCYHMHRFSPLLQGFSKMAFTELRRRMDSIALKYANNNLSSGLNAPESFSSGLNSLRLVGFSGLCVSVTGQALFARLGCEEKSAFRSSEHVVRRKEGSELEVVDIDPDMDVQEYRDRVSEAVNLEDGGSIIRCKMMVWQNSGVDDGTLVYEYLIK